MQMRGVLALGICLGVAWGQPLRAGMVCPPANMQTPMLDSQNVLLDQASVSSAQFPGSWQKGTIGQAGYAFRIFGDGSGSVGSDDEMRNWRVDFECDLATSTCAYLPNYAAPQGAMDTAKELGNCIISKPPKPKTRPEAKPQLAKTDSEIAVADASKTVAAPNAATTAKPANTQVQPKAPTQPLASGIAAKPVLPTATVMAASPTVDTAPPKTPLAAPARPLNPVAAAKPVTLAQPPKTPASATIAKSTDAAATPDKHAPDLPAFATPSVAKPAVSAKPIPQVAADHSAVQLITCAPVQPKPPLAAPAHSAAVWPKTALSWPKVVLDAMAPKGQDWWFGAPLDDRYLKAPRSALLSVFDSGAADGAIGKKALLSSIGTNDDRAGVEQTSQALRRLICE